MFIMITQISGGVCAVGGVKAYGIKPGKMGLAIILGEGTAAGVFTRNKIIAAPAMLTRSHLEKNGGRLCGIIANSGNANAFTGEQGMADARAMAALLAEKLGVDPELIGVASTGVIGRKLDVDWIAAHTNDVFEKVTDSEEGNLGAMKAIMTTDTKQKECAVEVTVPEGKFRIGGICKGAGMIEPNMGTMLSFVYTDAGISSAAIRQSLVSAADKSFNMVVVDGDTSTNDMCLLTATGKSGIDVESSPALKAAFTEGLETVMTTLAKKIAADGEGASKLIQVTVTGAATHKDAVLAAKSITRSPLFKSAVFGKDPNWGRAVAAAGYSGAEFDQTKISLAFSDGTQSVHLVKSGEIIDKSSGNNLDLLKKIMSADTVYVEMDLGAGTESAVAWGCDLTYDYVRINADYTT